MPKGATVTLLDLTDPAGLPGLKLRQIAPALDLSLLLLRRKLPQLVLAGVKIADGVAIQTPHVCAVLVDQIAC
jgi:hypothetical protein